MLLNERRFIDTEQLARHLYAHLMRLPEMHIREFSHIRPFRQWPDLYDEFYEIASQHKLKDESRFNEKMKKMKGEFIIRYSPHYYSDDKKVYGVIASITDFQITLHKAFFKEYKKRQRIEVLSHELIHLVQHIFPHVPDEKREYQHQPYEVEALSKDIVYDLRVKIRRGKVKNQEEARKEIANNPDFEKFTPKQQNRMMKKILLDLYYHNPIHENLNEARYFNVGKLPEMFLNRVEEVLLQNRLPAFKGKDGAIKIRKKHELSKKKEVVEGLFRNNLDMWKEFKRVLLDKYSKDLLDLKQTKKMYRDSALTIYPNKEGVDGGFAFVNQSGLSIFKDFFKIDREEQLSILHHEITHLIQSQFPIFAGKYWQKMKSGKNVYEEDPFELQAYGNEIVRIIGDLVRKNEIKSMEEVAREITGHEFYQKTSDKFRKKLFQKVMANVKGIYNLPTTTDMYTESINELLLPSKKLDDDTLIDSILKRKELRKEAIESKFLLLFFRILKVYNIEPETFINRYHKYVDGIDTNSISIEDIKDFLRFAGKADEHSKVLRVLRISQKRLDNLKNRFETKLLEPMKRIMRHDTTDATHAGIHFPASGKRYNAMLIKALQKAEKVKTLKEKGKI